MESIFLPIPDMCPPTVDQADQACALVEARLAEGKAVCFHCHGGRGRTGTLLAAQIIFRTPDSEAAVAAVRTANRHWIESESQMAFLEAYARHRRNEPSTEIPSSHKDVVIRPRSFIKEGPPRGGKAIPKDHDGKKPDLRAGRPNRRKRNKMSLEKTLQTSMGTIPECVASGYVDMDSGLLLGVSTVDSHPQDVLDTLAAATADLFQGSTVVLIEKLFKQSRGTERDSSHYFQEMIVFSENLLHVFMRTKRYPEHVVCFVCRKSANVGMVLTKARMSVDKVALSV